MCINKHEYTNRYTNKCKNQKQVRIKMHLPKVVVNQKQSVENDHCTMLRFSGCSSKIYSKANFQTPSSGNVPYIKAFSTSNLGAGVSRFLRCI